MKSSISFGMGFMGPMRNDGVLHTYSMHKAKALIRAEVKARKDLVEVKVGLDGDWNCNNDVLWDKKGFHKPDFYKQSCWAKPSLLFVYKDGSERDGGYCYEDKESV